MYYRRRLPHIFDLDRSIFITWRLHGSLPANRPFAPGKVTSGQAFVAMDRLLDTATWDPLYLRQPAIARMVVDAIVYNGEELGQYDLHAFVVMPNHVHVLITALAPLPAIMKSLKNITAKRANLILGRGGIFWQRESYDRMIRDEREFDRVRNYIERNPVAPGLARDPAGFPYSSAAT
jgi:putative DNA methylase